MSQSMSVGTAGTVRRHRYTGVFPVVPTTFDDAGNLDLESQKRAIDFLIDAGSNGLCILANYSEQFALADVERDRLTATILEHVAGRVPVVVTTSHFCTAIAAERSRRAQQAGAALVMLMPPFFGATVRVGEAAIAEHFRRVAEAIDIPIVVQDAPMSGTPLSAAFLAQLAREIDHVAYFKIEVPGAAVKLRELIRLAGESIDGPWDGEESITLIQDLDAGANGTMPSAAIPDVLRQVVDLYQSGRRDAAVALYEHWLPLLNYENKQTGLLGCKALMKEGGIIASEAARHPILPLHPAIRAGYVELARRLDALILRWAR